MALGKLSDNLFYLSRASCWTCTCQRGEALKLLLRSAAQSVALHKQTTAGVAGESRRTGSWKLFSVTAATAAMRGGAGAAEDDIAPAARERSNYGWLMFAT